MALVYHPVEQTAVKLEVAEVRERTQSKKETYVRIVRCREETGDILN